MDNNRVAIVTGGNRGMGFAACRELARRGYRVLLGSRDPDRGEDAAEQLRAQQLSVQSVALDVNNAEHITDIVALCRKQYGRVDVLLNNAGMMVDDPHEPVSILHAEPDSIASVLAVNTLAPIRISQAIIPLMRENSYGRIVNVSSGMGQLQDMAGNHAGYRISKTALNATTRIFAAELNGTNIKVNAVCPGWVRTDMGGSAAHRSVEEGIETIIWLATLPDDGPEGGFFRDRKAIAW